MVSTNRSCGGIIFYRSPNNLFHAENYKEYIMKNKNLVPWLIVAIIAVFGWFRLNQISNTPEALQYEAEQQALVNSPDFVAADHPGYDPEDPMGVKFGFTGLAYILGAFLVLTGIQMGFPTLGRAFTGKARRDKE